VKLDRDLPFRGEVIWLTPEQGGRKSGPPRTPADQDYVATAYVPPKTANDGLTSFILRVADRTAWRSEASGDWLAVANEGCFWIDEGALVVITEGPTAVAYFEVRQVF
jgi:hypothetical protein